MSKHSERNENEKTKSREIGKRLQDLRLMYGEKVNRPNIRQGDFGAILGIGGDSQGSRDTLIGRLERGVCDIKPSELQKYSQVCGVSVDYIVNGSEYEKPTPEITFVDLCREIINLDKCGLIEFVKRQGQHGILIRDITPPDLPNPQKDPNVSETDIEIAQTDREQAFIAYHLDKFIESYCAVQEIKNDLRIPKRDWAVTKLSDDAIDDFQWFAKQLDLPESSKRLLADIEAAEKKRYLDLPFE